MNNLHHVLAYCSPAGSTAKLSEAIKNKLSENDFSIIHLNLGDPEWEKNAQNIFSSNLNFFLWIGSPVYAQHPVPPVYSFLNWLPKQKNDAYAVPYVSWGEVCTGTALLEMGQALENKGFKLAGAAKIPAEHSSMWKSQYPLGAGHPDSQDIKELLTLVEKIIQGLATTKLTGISSKDLDYQTEKIKEFANSISIEKVKKLHPGYSLDQEKCTQCGTCRDNCPAGAISLDPFPVIGEECFLCNNCARLCPEGAIDIDSSQVEKKILDMQQQFAEDKSVRIFF
jgi:ferredoxin